MLTFRNSSRAFAAACGMAWAATSAAQSLPSPAAPATLSRTAPAASAASASPRTSSGIQQMSGQMTPASGSGVISADHLFNSQAPPRRVTPTGHHQCATDECCGYYGCPQADEGYVCCLFNDDAEAIDLGQMLFGEESAFDLGGWTQFGYHSKDDGVFNTKPHDFQAQQMWLFAEKVADGSEGLDWGFRVDLMYGTDAANTQAFGNRPGRWDYLNGWDRNAQYGWALPQLYGEIAIDKLSVKLGHFYTLLGYEVVGAPGNFFYSHAYTMNFSEAFTHTGALATYAASDDVTVYGGWTLGWDTGFDQLNNGNSFLGGASVALTDELTLIYILTAGKLGWVGEGYTHSIVLDYNITDKLEYVFQSDLVGVDSPNGTTNLFTGANQTHYDTIGINQYLFYKLTEQVKAGGRLEWWKADGTSFYAATLGVNVAPTPNVLIRPEVRHNWSPSDALIGTPYGDETIGAIDLIFTF